MSLHFGRFLSAARPLAGLVKTVAPFAAAFIPGVGPGVALALRAAGAISTVSDIAEGVRGYSEGAGQSAVVGTPLMQEAVGAGPYQGSNGDDMPPEDDDYPPDDEDFPPED